MSAFLTLSAMTSALLLLMAALMDGRAVRAGSAGQPRLLRAATVLSALATLPVGWVVWLAAGGLSLAGLTLAAVLWHGALYVFFAYWIHSLSRRVARNQTKA